MMVFTFFPFLILLLELGTGVNSSELVDLYSEVFPSLNDVVSMSRLSSLVYEFRSRHNFTCVDFPSSHELITKDVSCEMYLHDETLGTQVLLVLNKKERYIAIVFSGTDDIRTSLEDANMFTKPFGNNSTVRLDDHTDDPYKMVRVHAGFNKGIFSFGIWEKIYSKITGLLRQNPSFRLWTTGHSLGAANAILTATAFATLDHNREVLSVNFGSPQTGNLYWRDYFSVNTSSLTNNLGIWRVVLASDLIARLPEYLYHVGHTIQLDGKTDEPKVYYEHYGNIKRKFAGAPNGWYRESYEWFPYAMNYHRMSKYLKHLEEMNPSSWVKHFYPIQSSSDPRDVTGLIDTYDTK
mmetsp:Transcript_8504/g.9900  ORF Transcript_8504/g.9900 Transcript_8504/m.9900 type:complete len:351 (+) Transcript_8504:198-1250(+)